jgi:CheY-like chemotaxis protein
MTVLYVEDNASNVRLIERVMAHRPHVTLLTALRGALGLEMARTHRPDLILLDLGLPDTPGAEVLRALREDPTTCDIPVVVVSADATAAQISLMLASGAADYLTKPFEVASLLGLVDAQTPTAQRGS